MKNSEIVSAFIGAGFFAIPYLALAMPLLPSVALGTGAFIAGELIMKKDIVKKLKEADFPLYQILQKAKKENDHILEMSFKIDDLEVRNYLNEINSSVNKIIKVVEKEPKKKKKLSNFFDYYLPVTIKIVDRYDEIENEKLSSKEIKKFNESSLRMICQINDLFKKFIDNLYSADLDKINVEMKVLNSMIKADGLDEGIIVDKEVKDE